MNKNAVSLRKFVELIRKYERCLGDGKKKFLNSEKLKLKENKYW